jgi:hypothetical protein
MCEGGRARSVIVPTSHVASSTLTAAVETDHARWVHSTLGAALRVHAYPEVVLQLSMIDEYASVLTRRAALRNRRALMALSCSSALQVRSSMSTVGRCTRL